LIGNLDASRLGIAPVVGARVAIAADEDLQGRTGATLTLGRRGAGIAIIAGLGVGRKDTIAAVARLVRAGISVIAGKDQSALTITIHTHIIDGARIAVVAGPRGVLVATPATWKAAIYGAWVSIGAG
jgi:hypothetical protein